LKRRKPCVKRFEPHFQNEAIRISIPRRSRRVCDSSEFATYYPRVRGRSQHRRQANYRRRTRKKAIDVDVIAGREFATQLWHYDVGKYAPVIVTGEERPGETVPGTAGTYVLVDALDGSDLAERGLANWCAGAVFFEVAGPPQRFLPQ
jgi:hypothetical protein